MKAPAAPPILHLIVGPNGAGKTTFYDLQLKRLTGAEFVNADLLALQRFGKAATTREESEAGQAMADARRRELIAQGRSLVAESTFSHPAKLDLIAQAKAAGYRVVVYHLNLRDADLAVMRVRSRVALGGHPAPEDRVRARYARNQPLIRQAVLTADLAYVFDTSRLGEPPRRLISFERGRVTQAQGNLPAWAKRLYAEDLARR